MVLGADPQVREQPPHAAARRPAPPWRDGTDENEIIVPEPERPGTEPPLRDRPDLGRTTVVTLE